MTAVSMAFEAGRCVKRGYDLRGLLPESASGLRVCPECGTKR